MSDFVIDSVDATTTLPQSPRVAALSNGNFVAVWNASIGGDSGLLAQIYAPDGTTVGTEFRVESTTAGTQVAPNVTALPGGGFIVVWHSNDNATTGNDIRTRIFDETGAPAGNDYVINSTPSQSQTNASVTVLADGRVLVAWQSDEDLNSSATNFDIRAILLNADGTPSGTDFVVNGVTSGSQNTPQVTALSDGGYVILWQQNAGASFTHYNAAGEVVGTTDTLVALSAAQGDVQALDDGKFVVTWTDADGIHARTHLADGTGAEVLVHDSIPGSPPRSAVLDNGDFVVTWSVPANAATGEPPILYARHLAEDGTAKTEALQVNTTVGTALTQPELTVLDDGQVAFTWRATVDGVIKMLGAVMQFEVEEEPSGTAPYEFEVAANVHQSNMASLGDGAYIVVWNGVISDATHVLAQRYAADGTPVGERIQVSESPVVGVGEVSVAVLDNGNLVFNWGESDGSAYGVKNRVFDSAGAPVTSVTQANATTQGNQSVISTVALDNGGYVVTYQSGYNIASVNDDGSGSATRAQIFDANGVKVGSEFITNQTTAGHQEFPDTASTSGGFVVAYTTPDADGSLGVRAVVYDNTGAVRVAEFVVAGSAVEDTAPAVKSFANGNLLVAWVAYDQDTGGYTLKGSVFGAGGSAIANDITLEATPETYDYIDDIVLLPNGNLLVVWESADESWSSVDLFGQVMAPDGALVGDRLTLVEAGDGEYLATGAVEVIDADTVVVSWWNSTTDRIMVKTVDIDPGVSNALPGDLALSASTVAEDAAVGTVIGELSAADADGDTLIYSLADDADGRFSLVAEGGTTRLVVNGALDHEAAASHSVSILVSDGKGGDVVETFAIDVTDVTEYTQPINLGDFVIDAADATFAEQTTPNVAALGNGNVVAVWRGNASGDVGIRAQIFDAEGGTVGAEFAIETSGTGTQSTPQLATLANGGFAAVWQSNDLAGDNNIRVRVFDQSGAGAATDVVVNTLTGGTQSQPEITTLADGRLLVAWSSAGEGSADSADGGIQAVVLDADGSRPAGTSEFLVNAINMTGSQVKPSVTALSDGYVISWLSVENATYVVRATRYDMDGHVVGTPEMKVNSTTITFSNPPQFGELANGGLFAAWQTSDLNDGNGQDIRARAFDANGNPTGDDFVLNTFRTGYQTTPAMTVLDDGRMIAVWTSPDGNGGFGIRGRMVDADGTPLGTDFAVNAGTFTNAATPTVTQLENGDVVVSWISNVNNVRQVMGTVLNIDGSSTTDNHAPSGLSLSASTIAENSAHGAVIGELSATDADGDALIYSLTDNGDGKFSLLTEGGVTRLVVNGALDHEAATSHDVSVKVSDGKGGETTETFAIDVTDVAETVENAAPVDIAISSTSIRESARAGFEVGVLSATDPDGDPITWTIDPTQGDNNDFFKLRDNGDGTTSVVLKNPLDHEALNGGVYDLVVTATDNAGHATSKTIEITAADYPLIFSASPTGKDYAAISEAAAVGQKIGLVYAYENDFTVASVTLADDFNGAFSIVEGQFDGKNSFYLAVNKPLDYETTESYDVTFEVTDTTGVVRSHTVDLRVLDAADEIGDTPRGTITIDANTTLAATKGGVDWDTYVADYFAQSSGLPTTSGASWFSTSDTWTYTNSLGLLALKGSDIIYNWADPVSGEDAHIVSGSISEMVFGTGTTTVATPEISITGLDLSNDTSLVNRIAGDVNLMASAFMHGPSSKTPAEIAAVEAILDSYAQNFKGSAGNDVYTGTIFNDTITGNGGDDRFDGGAGDDKITFAGASTGYTFAARADGSVKITAKATGAETVARNIEGAEFSDATIDLSDLPSEEPAENQAARIDIDGGLVFTSGSVDIPRYGPYAAALAEDVDGDGDLDIVVVDKDGDSIDWYANDGQGNIGGTATKLGISPLGFSLEVADLDGDGIKDFVVTSNGRSSDDPDGGKVVWYKGDGAGNFGAATDIVSGKLNSFDTVAVDFDKDGDIDLLTVAYSESGAVTLSTNDGNGNFTNTMLDAGAVNPQAIRVADVNGDGKLDIITSGAAVMGGDGWGTGSGVAVSLNNGDGTFAQQILTAATGNPGAWDVEIADLDGDGHLDLVSTNPNLLSVTWFRNNGDGTFGGPTRIGDPQGAGRVDTALGDVDGDGDIDVVTTESASDDWPMKISWFENDGSGNFTERKTSAVAEPEATIVLADIDGNGTLDILRGGRAGASFDTQRAADVQFGFRTIGVAENAPSSLSAIAFTDATTGSSVTVTLMAASGTLAAASGSGVTAAGTGTAALTLTGSLADINAFLAADKATFTTALDQDSDVRLTIAIDDGVAGGAKSTSTTILLDVAPQLGEPPADLQLSNTTVAENSTVGTVVGALSAADPEGGVLTYALSDDAGGLFALSTDGNGTSIVVNGALDHEAADGHNVTVSVTDTDGNVVTSEFAISVADVDEAPQNLALSNDDVAEDAAVGTVVGTLSATDPEGAGAITYALTGNADGLFELAGSQLRVKAGLDYETAASHDITVRATDATGKVTTQVMTVNVGNVDEGTEQPDMITIDASGSASMDFEAYVRGTFLTGTTGGGMPVFDNSGAFAGEEMFIGFGASASSKYVLMHGNLVYNFPTHTVGGTANTIEYGTRGAGTYDASGYFTGGSAELRITGLDLSNAIPANDTEAIPVELNGPIHNFAVANMYGASGDLSRLGKYADALDAYAQNYLGSSGTDVFAGTRFDDEIAGNGGDDTLAGGAGDDEIDGGSGSDAALFTGNKGDYALTRNANGTWSVTDKRAGSINDGTDTLRNVESATFADETVTLDVTTPDNTAPTALSLTGDTVAENAANGTVIGLLSATDADGDALTYTLTGDAGGKFSIVTEGGSTRLVVNGALDFETSTSHDVTVKVSDGEAETSATFTIDVTDLADNMAPTGLALAGNTIAEDATSGRVVGTLSAIDADGDRLTYELTDDADGKFALLTSGTGANAVHRLVVVGALDFESASSHQVGVKVSDGHGGETTQTFAIGVTDVLESTPAGTITIDASGSGAAGMSFESFIRGGFLAGTTGGGMPGFDNSGTFVGEEMMIGFDGAAATSKYVFMHGNLEYKFATHTVGGTANTIEYGTRGTGSYDANGYFTGGNVQLRITGLDLSNPIPANDAEAAPIEIDGAIHNFATAHMYGAPGDATRLGKYADALDEYAQNFIGTTGSDAYAGTRFDDLITGNGGNDLFDGGAGRDTIVFDGAKSGYVIATTTAGAVTVTNSASGATATLTNIESARFSDQTVELAGGQTKLTLSSASVAENAGIDTVIGTFAAIDPDGVAYTLTLQDDADGRFRLVTAGGVTQLVLAAAIDYETATSHPVTVRITDSLGGVTTQDFAIQVLDIDEGNTPGIDLSRSSIAEDADIGAAVGRLTLADADTDDVTWSLSGDAGKFALETNANGVTRLVVDGKLDYETRTSFDITLTASDGEVSSEQSFTIDITDVAEVISGSSGNDILRGDATPDMLKGGAGNDQLFGGGGADRLTGGAGADRFVFTAISQSTPDSFDVITDFKGRRGDIIDLSGIDADQGLSGTQRFDFIGRDDFSGAAGELRFETSGNRTFVEADTDGDGNADFVVQLLGGMNLKEDFFIF